MVNYKVTNYQADISNPSFLTADVVEVNTNQTIKTNVTAPEARDLCRSLNFGNGFDGFTPAFFLEKLKFPTFVEGN